MKIELEIVDKENRISRKTTLDERWYGGYTDDQQGVWWLPSITWIAGYYPKGVGYLKHIADKGWDEAERVKIEAGDRGTIVHHAIEKLMHEKKLGISDVIKDREGLEREMTPDEYYAVLTFKQWYESVGQPPALAIEKTVLNKKHGYGGTLDYLFKTEEGNLLLDIKTSKEVWPSHEIQLSALREACLENNLQVDKMAVLQVGYTRNKTQHYKFTEISDQFDIFLSAMRIWKNEHPATKPLQRDYPLEITL